MLIARYLLKYGWAAFSLTIVSMGGTQGEVTTLEQFYLDNYACALNINRTASNRYTRNTNYSPKGEGNPMFGKAGSLSPVWGRQHEASLIQTWSLERTSGPYYLYDFDTKELVSGFY